MYAVWRELLIFVILDLVRRMDYGCERYGQEADYRVTVNG
jgi:hypothetical protein